MSEPMTFIVDRCRWYCGQGGTHAALLRSDGTRCFLGFLGLALGIPDAEMIGVLAPKRGDTRWPAGTDAIAADVIIVDADMGASEPDREAALARIVAPLGYVPQYVGDDS